MSRFGGSFSFIRIHHIFIEFKRRRNLKMFELERLVDFTQETLAEYTITSDLYRKYHCIVLLGSSDISGALEDTLHFLIEAGASNEDIRDVMGAEVMDLNGMNEEEREEYTSIDLGFSIRGQLMMFQPLMYINEYRKYCMMWYAEHEITLEGIFEEIDADDSDGIYVRMADYAYACTGERPLDFIEFEEKYAFKKPSPKEIRVNTKSGSIKAFEVLDDEYPGIALVLESPKGGEPGAVMEYHPGKNSVDLRVYGMTDPDGDPIEVYAMN